MLCRSREKNATLERSLLEVRLWRKDKAMAAEREQETGLRTRSLEQQVGRVYVDKGPTSRRG